MSVYISANQNYIKLVSVSLALGWSVTPGYRFSLQNPSKKVLNIEMWMLKLARTVSQWQSPVIREPFVSPYVMDRAWVWAV